jgi:hypothetical protein
MFKALMGLVLVCLFLLSGIALGADMKTAEKWVCSRDGVVRVVRLYAPEKGASPCKVFYFKRDAADPSDAIAEAEQAAGIGKPIYYSTGNGGFCVRKMDEFLADRQAHRWACLKQ